MIKNPERAARFVRYAEVQDHRALDAARKTGVSDEAWDEAMRGKRTAAEIEKRYQKVKAEFQRTGKTRVAPSWQDLDVPSMIRRVGEPFQRLYLFAYTIPTLHLHASFASTFPDKSPREEAEADFAFKYALLLMLTVINDQNQMYSLGMDEDIVAFAQVLGQNG